MATSAMNQDGTLTVTLTPTEQGTFDGLPVGQLNGYITLWLADHAPMVFVQRFEKLSDAEKSDVMVKIEAVEDAEEDKL